ncbi:MAG TPA: glycosyltransferase [archaeon]|nr:glycosyltransferase [archaeon]
MELSIILPTYNERENIEHVILELESFFSKKNPKKKSFEIIVIDDSSPDKTAQEVERIQSRFTNLVLIKDRPKEGIGKALECGYNIAKGKWLLSMDADRAFLTNDLERILIERENGFDFIVGSKYATGSHYIKNSFIDLLRSKISEYGNTYISLVSGVPLKDFSMNFRLLKKEVWKSINPKDNENFFLVEMLVEAHYKGYKIKELGVSLLPRDFGVSKTRVWKQAGKFLVKSTAFLWTRRAN